MSIVSGQDSRLQIGLANTWRVPTRTKQRVPFTQEGFKGTPNYKESDALVGASGITGMSIMSYKADGSLTSYLPIDLAKLLLAAALGFETAPAAVPGNAGQYVHKFEPVPSGACSNLPSLTVEIDRLLERALYMNFKIGTWKISGKAEDYVMFECDGPAFKESIQNVLAKFVVAGAAAVTPDGTTGEITLAVHDRIVLDNNGTTDELVGKILRIQDKVSCGQVFYFVVTEVDDTTPGSYTLTAATMRQAATGLPAAMLVAGARPLTPWWESNTILDLRGLTAEIVDWEMAPSVPLSTKEYLRFVHGYLYMDDAVADYAILHTKTGIAGDVVIDCPASVTSGFEVEGRDLQGVPRIFKYIGAAVTPAAGVITFSDTPILTDGTIQSVYDGGILAAAAWEIGEDLYDEVTDFTIGGDNKMADGKFGLNGSMYQSEVNPTSRDFTLDLTARFTERLSKLRKQRMMTGRPMSVRLEFETTIGDGPEGYDAASSVDSQGRPYRLVLEAKKCYYTDGIPNIGGADEPTVSPKLRCAETPTVHKAITAYVYDDKNEAVLGTSDALAAEWKVSTREDAFLG